ncbi:MAG: hypothetical protein ACYC7D_04990 [Nitrososphaerales archaeon]
MKSMIRYALFFLALLCTVFIAFYLHYSLWISESPWQLPLFLFAYIILVAIAGFSIMSKEKNLFLSVLLMQGFAVYWKFVLIYGINLAPDNIGEVAGASYTLAHGWPGAVQLPQVTDAFQFSTITSNITGAIATLLTSLSIWQVFSFVFPIALLLIPLSTYLIFSQISFGVGALSAEILVTDYSTLVTGQGIIRDHMSELFFLLALFCVVKGLKTRSFWLLFLLSSVGMIVSHITTAALLPFLIVAVAINYVRERDKIAKVSVAFVIMLAWYSYGIIGPFGGGLSMMISVIQLAFGVGHTTIEYSSASTFAPTGSQVELIINLLYRSLMVAGLFLLLLIYRRSRQIRLLPTLAFFFLAILAIYIILPGAFIAQPARFYDLYLPLLSGMLAFGVTIIAKQTARISQVGAKYISTMVVVSLLVAFSFNAMISTPPYQYTPWATMSQGEKVATSSFSLNYPFAKSAGSWLDGNGNLSNVVASDQSGIVALSSIEGVNPQIVFTTQNVTGDLFLVNSYYLQGYSAWGFGIPFPNGSLIIYQTPTVKSLFMPLHVSQALLNYSLIYDNGGMFIFGPTAAESN